MTRTAQTNLTDRGLNRTIIVGTHLLIVVVFLCLAPMLVSAQSMGNYSTYSDTWLDDSTGTVNIKGCGVTQDYNNTYNHSYWVVTKLTAPDSSTFSTTTSYSSSSYARAETSLPAAEGDFALRTEHWMRCPYMGGSGFPSTVLNLLPRITLHAYERDYNTADEWVPTCQGQCTLNPRYRNPNHPSVAWIQCYSSLGPDGCGVAFCIDHQLGPGKCSF